MTVPALVVKIHKDTCYAGLCKTTVRNVSRETFLFLEDSLNMAQTFDNENQFVVDLLTTLRNERFSPLAWVHFLQRSWEMSCATARANPSLKGSWPRITLLIGVLALAVLAASFIFEGPQTASRLLPGFLFCVTWQQSDLFWHLGLNRQVGTGKLLPTVRVAHSFAWLGAFGPSFLVCRLVGGVSTPSCLALLVFLAGIATEMLDGHIARRTK